MAHAAGAREILERPDDGGCNGPASNQPKGEQVSDPPRIVAVALATRHVPDVHRSGEDEVKCSSNVFPAHTDRFHRHTRADVRGQPSAQAPGCSPAFSPLPHRLKPRSSLHGSSGCAPTTAPIKRETLGDSLSFLETSGDSRSAVNLHFLNNDSP